LKIENSTQDGCGEHKRTTIPQEGKMKRVPWGTKTPLPNGILGTHVPYMKFNYHF